MGLFAGVENILLDGKTWNCFRLIYTCKVKDQTFVCLHYLIRKMHPIILQNFFSLVCEFRFGSIPVIKNRIYQCPVYMHAHFCSIMLGVCVCTRLPI